MPTTYEVHFYDNGDINHVKVHHRGLGGRVVRGETVKFCIPASTKYKTIEISKNKVLSDELFGQTTLEFNKEYAIAHTATAGVYTYTPAGANPGTTDPPSTGTIGVGSW